MRFRQNEQWFKLPIQPLKFQNMFSRYQYTANAPVLSDIYGSGPREKT